MKLFIIVILAAMEYAVGSFGKLSILLTVPSAALFRSLSRFRNKLKFRCLILIFLVGAFYHARNPHPVSEYINPKDPIVKADDPAIVVSDNGETVVFNSLLRGAVGNAAPLGINEDSLHGVAEDDSTANQINSCRDYHSFCSKDSDCCKCMIHETSFFSYSYLTIIIITTS